MNRVAIIFAAWFLTFTGCYNSIETAKFKVGGNENTMCHWLKPECAKDDFDGDGLNNEDDPCPTNPDPAIQCGDGCRECGAHMQCSSKRKCECAGNWDPLQQCAACVERFDPATDCTTCLVGYLGAACNVCVGYAYGTYPDCYYPKEAAYFESGPYFPTPSTGQKSCFDAMNAMASCPGGTSITGCSLDFCGQDAQYHANSFSFSCYSSGGVPQSPCDATADAGETVADGATGLIWQRISSSAKDWTTAKEYCSSLVYAGRDDWRLPTPVELLSIVDAGRTSPSIDLVAFPDTPPSLFWTSKASANDTAYAWVVSFYLGSVTNTEKTTLNDVRCVTDIVSPTSLSGFGERYTKKGTEEPIVFDAITRRMWSLDIVEASWQGALRKCEESTWHGYNDWRLPNLKELAELVNYGRFAPASDFPDIVGQWYWTSSTCLYDPQTAWSVDKYAGNIQYQEKSKNQSVICVRL